MAGKPTSAKVKEIALWHTRDRGWAEIGYHFLIDRDGTVATGRAIEKVGAHVQGHNTGTIGISLLGGHGGAATDQFLDNFTAAQESALIALIAKLQGQYGKLAISGHNQYAAKACPCFDAPSWYRPAKYTAQATPKPLPATPIAKTAQSPWAAIFQAIAAMLKG
jgi:N-acetyl-anhydromuramyl-L-alanine amidase AmpD